MRILLFAVLACGALTACSSPQQTAGTAAGVAAGAVIAGPIGAVAGGAIGAVATSPGRTLDAGYCYLVDRRNRIVHDRRGRPLVRRC